MTLSSVTVGDTAIYPPGQGPNFKGGFDSTEIIDPLKNAGQNGYVSGVVFHLKKGTTLDELTLMTNGTASVINVQGEGPAIAASPATAQLIYQDGLVGSGQEVDNKLTIGGGKRGSV